MAENKICPICGSDKCNLLNDDDFNFTINCSSFQIEFRLSRMFVEDFGNRIEFSKAMDLIVEKLIRQKNAPNGAKWFFYCSANQETALSKPENINLATLLLGYPLTFMEKADRALMNISIRHPYYGRPLTIDSHDYRMFFAEQNDVRAMLFILEDLGYVRKPQNSWIISAEGWKHIESLRKKHLEVKQGFIAMSFKPEAESIRNSFKTAIKAAGFMPMVIDEKEHNHQIVPELLMEIERSKFLVLDVTYPNYGAYYEAGYALALGKEVIICCDKKVFSDYKYERPHFDIAQTSQIRWNSEEELIERLIKRIKATVTD
jgi:nucleoside 2-deoxyribosyltransferase